MFPRHLCIPASLLFGYCPGTKHKCPRCACPLLPLQTFIWMPLGQGAGTREGVGWVHVHRAGDETRGGVSLTHRLFLGLMPAVLLRESWRPSRMFFLVPHPKTKLNILEHHHLRRCHGIWGRVGVFNRWFHHHSSWTKNRARMLRRTRKVAEQTQGKFPRALITSLGRASQCILSSLQFLVQFQGISSQQQVEWINTWLPA